ncbi:MAG: hypothetical protein CM1200mP2_36210 [Planctomycetaceae bacterium]|nr:MAG: hypothetical protein CM1200mP2_36210 [Planctomycetaceae bacterium]
MPVVGSIEPSYLLLPLPEDDEGRTSGRRRDVERASVEASAVAIGPGWGRCEALERIASSLFVSLAGAPGGRRDALNALAAVGTLDSTPCGRRTGADAASGEMARLLGTDVSSVEAGRQGLAADLGIRSGAVVVLKGAGTVITDGRRQVINDTGNSGLATGGSGDVLTGLVTGLLARGMSSFDAAWLGVHLHGLAADLASWELGQSGLIASDLPDWIPAAWCAIGDEGGWRERLGRELTVGIGSPYHGRLRPEGFLMPFG